MGWLKEITFWLITFLAIVFGLVLYWHNSIFVLVGPDNGFLLTKTESVRYSIYLPAFYLHITTGSLVLMMGVFQLSKWLRTRYAAWHRYAGRVYAFVVMIFTAPSGLAMALYANGGWLPGLGFALLASLWWLFTWKGFQHARHKRWDLHREFMLRSYAMAFSAVTLRLYSFFFALAGYRGEPVYILIAWLSWVPTLVVVEVYVRGKNKQVTREAGIKIS